MGVSITELPSKVPRWEFPLWKAWYARKNVGSTEETLLKMLALSLKDLPGWESLRSGFALRFDNKYVQMAEEEEEQSLEVARRIQAAIPGLISQFGPGIIKKK